MHWYVETGEATLDVTANWLHYLYMQCLQHELLYPAHPLQATDLSSLVQRNSFVKGQATCVAIQDRLLPLLIR